MIESTRTMWEIYSPTCIKQVTFAITDKSNILNVYKYKFVKFETVVKNCSIRCDDRNSTKKLCRQGKHKNVL